MNKELYEFKEKLLNTGMFKPVSGSHWYRLRECPFCGDGKWHMYVCINLSSDDVVGYNCFKCNKKGLLNQKFLDYFGLNDLKLPSNISGSRKVVGDGNVSTKIPNVNVNEHDYIDGVCKYTMDRVGTVLLSASLMTKAMVFTVCSGAVHPKLSLPIGKVGSTEMVADEIIV